MKIVAIVLSSCIIAAIMSWVPFHHSTEYSFDPLNDGLPDSFSIDPEYR